MRSITLFGLFLASGIALQPSIKAADHQLLGWNNLGMHCMDSDYSVFSVLPPYNTIEAQLIVGGKLVTNGTGYSVTYAAVADPDGSINRTSTGKGNFGEFDLPLFGADLATDLGLAGWAMPGTNNTPQAMAFEATNTPAPGVATRVHWFRAEGIPITPWDDAGKKNPYPLMRIIARNAVGTAIATNDVVLPVSDEMDCRTCHASGTQEAAQPAQGWVWSGNPERDYRLNILRLHDEENFAQHHDVYVSALSARGFNPQGLYRGVVADGKPVLCAGCHASEALGTGSYSNLPPLTASVHAKHARVVDPDLGLALDDSAHRAACYRCHPGSTTKCLRGAMGGAVASDGTLEMQCQSCHGNLSQVGAANRVGWFMEPNCQSCHSGTATSNDGQIRYQSCFTDTNWTVRAAVNQTFGTKANTPAAGLSLYRFSSGHGGLQCSACHGSTHAEFPATHRNDNLRNERIQGHAGTMIECTACHVSMVANASNAAGGPHGMHPLGQTWVNEHPDLVEEGQVTRAQCRACHGANDRGTVLSRVQATRTVSTEYGTKTFWRGQQIGCYDCHNGPSNEDPTANTPATVGNLDTNTVSGGVVSMVLPALDANGNPLTLRIVTQPSHGSVGISNRVATYFSEPGYVGSDTFTFAAFDTWAESNLGKVTVSVAQGPFSISAKALVPPSYPANWPAPFSLVATPVNVNAAPSIEWDFGDASPLSNQPYPTHSYRLPGSYNWSVKITVQSGSTTATTNLTGTIIVGAPVSLEYLLSGTSVILTWARTTAEALLEETSALSPAANWTTCTNVVELGSAWSVTVPSSGSKFYRLRKL
jgi:hypothetical protein